MGEFLPFQPLAQPRRVAELTPEVESFRAFKVKALETEASRVVNLAFCPTSPHCLAVVTGTKIGLWKCGQDGLEADGSITKFKDVTQCVAWRSDGRLLLAGEASGSCAVVQADTKKVLRRFRGHGDAVTCAAFATADKTRAATGSRDGKLRLWDVVTGDMVQTVAAHTDLMKFVATGAGGSGDTWITAGYDGQAKLWDLRMSNDNADGNAAASFQVDHGHPIEAAVAFPTGTLLATAGGPEVKLWDFTMSGRLVQGIPDAHSKAVTAVCLDSTASVLFTASFDGYAKVFSAAGFEHLHTWKQSAPVTCAAWRPDDRVFALGLDDGKWGFRLRKLEADQATEQKQALAKKQAKKSWAWQHGKMRGTDATPASDDEIVQRPKRQRKETTIDFFFKKFEYRKLGELMFRTEENTGLGIAEELVQRQALYSALADRSEEFCSTALAWLSKTFRGGGDILRQQLIMEVIHTLIDANKCLQPPSDPKVLKALKGLERKVGSEMTTQESLTETKAMLEAVLHL
mmetsp:Transcript_103582/g.195015  ORF Transcript_103582/g.195015 Transcript_103582/m.195015 type:complete len:516 (-) Transcript_103582:30-1577(-)